jgi:hypothetical protein
MIKCSRGFGGSRGRRWRGFIVVEMVGSEVWRVLAFWFVWCLMFSCMERSKGGRRGV